MPHGTNPARESLDRALSGTTIHRRLLLPADLADQLLSPEDEVLLGLPSAPDDTGRILVVTTREVILGRWDAQGRSAKKVKRERSVPSGDVRGASYQPGLFYKVEIDVASTRDMGITPSTVEDGIRFAHALHALATSGRIPAPMTAEEVVIARHARGTYTPDSVENRMRAAWDRALLATTALWNCTSIQSGPALERLQPGEVTLLILVGQVGVSTEYLAVSDRRVFRGSAPGDRVKERSPADVREAVFDEGFLKDVVRVEMHDGTSLTLDGIHPEEGREFVDAFNTLLSTGSLPRELLPFR